ncbi:unnamed protein product [Echinostoma caproni]|uniref:Chromosome transmission fidelity protein 8 homolog n=1 Tax=Echinostoma caproni TaxID=27848 RepID=A0A183AWS9_9TREM|nr:unnamed protein product [Echinostoma caproni]
MIVKIFSPSEKSEDWILMELQGELVSRSGETLSGKLIGDLHFSKQASVFALQLQLIIQGEPVFIVGHHVLFGKLIAMEKPFVVTKKSQNNGHTEYHVVGVVRKKLIFKTRPRPIILSGPKPA